MNPLYLLVLACPIGMGLMMLFMGKGMMGMGRGGKRDDAMELPASMAADPEKRLAVLQAQRQLLEAQIASMDDSQRAGAQGLRDGAVR